MSTTAKRLGGDRWLQIPATWGAYLRLERARGDKARPRYTFYKGRLTIVSPGTSHEYLKTRLAWCIEEVLLDLRIPFVAAGQVTLKQAEPEKKGTEADSTYYLTNIDRIRLTKNLQMGIDPAPDLVVEVVVSHPVRDALRVHAAFGVREVWVCHQGGLKILVLGADGQYNVSESSPQIPFLSPAELAPWVYRQDLPDDRAFRQLFREWVETTLVPRVRAGEG